MINQEFKVYKLNEEGIKKAEELGQKFDELLEYIKMNCSSAVGSERCLAITKTKLEEASFFAKKALAMLNLNQEGN